MKDARKPIKVLFSPLSRRFYATRAYQVLTNGAVECTGERFDVTDDIADLIRRHEVSFSERKTNQTAPPAPDPAEAMRAKCEDIVEAELVDSAEAAHTDDGDVYAAASAAYYALRTVRDRIAALKGNGEGK
jgi:hypothetical protein